MEKSMSVANRPHIVSYDNLLQQIITAFDTIVITVAIATPLNLCSLND